MRSHWPSFSNLLSLNDPLFIFTFCSHLMTPMMLSHLMTPILRNKILSLNGPFSTNKCWHWMTLIFTNKWPSLDMYLIFVWKEGLCFALMIESLTKWLSFSLKTEGFTKKTPFFFIVLTKWPSIIFCPHWKTPYFLYFPYFRGLVRTCPSLRYVSAPSPRVVTILFGRLVAKNRFGRRLPNCGIKQKTWAKD